jgi:hypothetical protein
MADSATTNGRRTIAGYAKGDPETIVYGSGKTTDMIDRVRGQVFMSRSVVVAMTGLVVFIGSLLHASTADEPAKPRKQTGYYWTKVARKYLSAMKEPMLEKLAEKDRASAVYRFLWLPSFHDQISVRFVQADEGAVLHAVRLSLDGDYEPRNIVERKSAKLSHAHWERIASRLDKAKFWTSPTEKRPPFGGITMDGDMLIIEGVKDGKYHVVRRGNPPGGDFVDLCQAMLFMSGIDVRRLWFEYRQ